MIDIAYYLVTKDIAARSGISDKRYKTKDGRYILDNKDLSRIRFTTDEYINGLEGVERITFSQAQTLIRKNNYTFGSFMNPQNYQPEDVFEDEEEPVVAQSVVELTQEPQESQEEPQEPAETTTIDEPVEGEELPVEESNEQDNAGDNSDDNETVIDETEPTEEVVDNNNENTEQ